MSSSCKTSVRPVACTSACKAFATCPERLRREAVNDALTASYGDISLSPYDWRGLKEVDTVIQ